MNQGSADANHSPDAKQSTRESTARYDTVEPSADTSTGPDHRLIDIWEIRAMFGLGRTAAYELTHRPDFPAPVVISARCYRWWSAEVAAFAAGLREQQGPPTRRRTHQAATSSDPGVPRLIGKVRMAQRGRKMS